MLNIQPDKIKSFSKNLPVFLLYVVSPKCKACESFKPALEEIQRQHRDILMRQVDIFEAESLATELGITGIPYVGIFQYGELIGGGTSSNKEAILSLIDYLKKEEGYEQLAS